MRAFRRCMGWHGCSNNATIQARGSWSTHWQWFCKECIQEYLALTRKIEDEISD